MKNHRTLRTFGMIAILEGISFLLLLGIAMPIKYFGNVDLGTALVRYIGTAHGFLFVLYVFLLLLSARQYNWKIGRSFGYFIMSFIPFGTFWVDKKINQELKIIKSA